MRVYLVNPSHVSFGIGVITPRWLFVLAAATPERYGDPILVDETLETITPRRIRPGDGVGIGIHTGNALRGYEVGRMARERGAYVIYGGIHATLYPQEAPEVGGAHGRGVGAPRTARFAPFGAPTAKNPASVLPTRSSKKSSRSVAWAFDSSPWRTTISTRLPWRI